MEKMTVRQMIEELQQCVDLDSEIHFAMADGCCGDRFFLDSGSVTIDDYGDKYVVIELPTLPFLTSCRSSSAAQNRASKACKKDNKDE